MKRNTGIAMALITLGVVYACNNKGDGTGINDTTYDGPMNPSRREVVTDSSVNRPQQSGPDTNNNFQSPATTQNDTLNRQ